MISTAKIDWKARKRSKRQFPDGIWSRAIDPSSVYLYRANIPFYDPKSNAGPSDLFVPECPPVFSNRIDFAEWVAVDAKNYGVNFEADYEWFLRVVDDLNLYEEVVTQASNHLVDTIEFMGPNPVISLDHVVGTLALPLILERLVKRRVLLWLFSRYEKVDVVARRLSYKPGSDKQWPGLRTLLSRCGLTLLDVQNPQASCTILGAERKWLTSN
ncbi:MAG: hypothetical protein KDB65_12205 [Calditrichaeota bacterium]|nr:hypothetical protein [Calditrichota bacterium]MCB9367575.1 hypothetical protein [Calditrichota bacterium]